MVARTGMANLIAAVRAKTNVGTADYTVNAVDYFSDDQIQALLDKSRELVYQEALRVEDEYKDATTATHGYYWRWADVEEAGTGGAFILTDGQSAIIDAADYTVDYERQRIQFDDDTFDDPAYVTYYTYDVNRAIADVWSQIAGFEALAFDVGTDGHDLKRSQKKKGAMDQEAFWRAKERGPVTGATRGGTKRIVRSDMRGQ